MPDAEDPEIAEFEAALLRSVGQAQRAEHAAVHAPWQAMQEALKEFEPGFELQRDQPGQ